MNSLKKSFRNSLNFSALFEKSRQQHDCSMPPPEDIIVKYIEGGYFVNLRRKFRRLLTVNESSQVTRSFLRSTATIREEKKRHLKRYYYMIHPFSDGRAYWEFFMMFVLFFLLILIPIENATVLTIWTINIPKLILDLICCVDIIITFISGYYMKNTKSIILKPHKVACRYLKGYFWIDLLSSIPIDVIVSISYHGQHFWLLKLLAYLKLLRLTTFLNYLNRLRDRRGYSIYKFKAFKLVLIFLIALLWATSFVYLIAKKTHNSWLPQELTVFEGLIFSCLAAIYNILLIGYGIQPYNHLGDILFSILCLYIGVVLQSFIYAETLQLLNKNLSASNKYQHMLHQLHEYIRYKQLPENMRKRILVYFEFRFEKNYYKEAEILNTLSDNLKQDILLHSCQSLVESVDFFRDIPPALLIRIVKCMKSEIYLTNDVIVRAGIAGDSMFFIASGTIAVYTITGKEICHLADGGHFGEIALMMDEKRVASVVAIECCELFNLNRKDFRRAIAPYPELSERMRRLAQNRLNKTMRYMSDEDIEEDKIDLENFKL